jgi:hypothetical protein
VETGIVEDLYFIERGVTQTLIEQGLRAELLLPGSVEGDPKKVMELLHNQQQALEGLFTFVKQERSLTVGYIKELHAVMTRSQETVQAVDQSGKPVEISMIHGDWKRLPNYPHRDGKVYLYCPPEHVSSEMDRLVDFHLKQVEEGVTPEVQAAWLHHRFTQVHPFQDGNGRMARALATIVLLRSRLFPFIVDREQRTEYFDLLSRADAGDLRPIVLFVARTQQKAFSRANLFLESSAPTPTTPEEAATGLMQAWILNDEARQKRLEQATRTVVSAITSTIGQEVNGVLSILQKGRPDVSLGSQTQNLAFLPESIQLIMASTYDAHPQSPITETSFHLSTDQNVWVRFYTFTDGWDVEETVHCIAVVQSSRGVELGTTQPWSFIVDQSMNQLTVSLGGWLKQALTAFLRALKLAALPRQLQS